MILKYDISIDNKAIRANLERVGNRIFKLLPEREESKDWETPLRGLIVEIGGMNSLLNDQVDLFHLLSKLESLLFLTETDDFLDFRKIIFECLNIIGKIKECL